jgi:hypothetical protein
MKVIQVALDFFGLDVRGLAFARHHRIRSESHHAAFPRASRATHHLAGVTYRARW